MPAVPSKRLWSKLSDRSKRRYRSQGVTPAAYNALQKAPAEEKRLIRAAVKESGLGSSAAYRKVQAELYRTGQYKRFWRDAKSAGVDRAEFDRRYVKAFGPHHQAKTTGRPAPTIDYGPDGPVADVLGLAGVRPDEPDLPPVGDTP